MRGSLTRFLYEIKFFFQEFIYVFVDMKAISLL